MHENLLVVREEEVEKRQMKGLNGPSIGVMCIDVAQSLENHLGSGFWHSYLPVSYVKQLESVGAIVVPIW